MTKRQKEILKLIIEHYIAEGEPLGSEVMLKTHHLNYSSATIRTEMHTLEKEGFLEKEHISSGRVPSIKGYEYYASNIIKDEHSHNLDLEKQIRDIFAKRWVAIDFALEEAAKAISEIAGLTLAISSSNSNEELMKSIQLTPINDKLGTIVIVTSEGRVESKIIEFNALISINDVRIAVRLFKERLLDTRLSELSLKIANLAPILAQNIKNYEALIQTFIGRVFDFHKQSKNKVYGNGNLIKSNDITREDVVNLINLMENKSIWESIESEVDEDERIKIAIQPNNIALISKRIETQDKKSREISIIGSHRMNYSDAKDALMLLEKFFENSPKDS